MLLTCYDTTVYAHMTKSKLVTCKECHILSFCQIKIHYIFTVQFAGYLFLAIQYLIVSKMISYNRKIQNLCVPN